MKRHVRFVIAFVIGAVVALLVQLTPLSFELRVLAAANAFFVSYLVMMLHFAVTTTPDELRNHAEQTDAGAAAILLFAVVAGAISLTSIILVLSAPNDSSSARFLALGSVPLGWAAVHVLAAFHYAYLFYQPRDKDAPAGLDFPGCKEPGSWDFLYFSFVIGMTAQVSDVTTTSPEMRKVVLLHSVGSFFYNTIILALAVNAAVTGAS
ncbi:MAG: hypothetical protein JWS10_1619 [Cypionkella sp.]|uniref:DUF1345 domain-containing protein n=1 Tax=Cypionkella sp. TaxID=2811411 RepID=UPI00260884F0|nr:DUF1345 domain-containing protein [Cypionkella sp.]MDB5659004.1 hypothetical protein [Cypionkella sp.]